MLGPSLVEGNTVIFKPSEDTPAIGQRIAEISASIADRIVASETGSKSAVIVCEDAKLDLAVRSGLISAFKTSGQRCVSAGRILVHEKLIDAYAQKLVSVA